MNIHKRSLALALVLWSWTLILLLWGALQFLPSPGIFFPISMMILPILSIGCVWLGHKSRRYARLHYEKGSQCAKALIALWMGYAWIVTGLLFLWITNLKYEKNVRTVDATDGLTKIAAGLERCHNEFGAYNNTDCTFTFVSNGALISVTYANLITGILSEDGYHDLTIATVAGSTAAQSYRLTATARPRLVALDGSCDTITLTIVGGEVSRGGTPAPAAGADNSCWDVF